MSLFRQLWLTVILGTTIAFAGSFLLSMFTARHYLEEQLAIKNSDNAATLALSMTQMEKDPVTVELLVAATFDSGQYAQVRVVDPEGAPLVERRAETAGNVAPGWFTSLFPIHSRPGSAQVSSGWSQFGTVEIVSHSDFAYRELWNGAIELLIWFLAGGSLLGVLGTQLLNRIRTPLQRVVEQAQGVSERRFATIDEPDTPELKSLARGMNTMVERLRAMFAEEAERLDQVRREATLDGLTGLANRSYFLNQLDTALTSEDAPRSGSLLMLRIADLAGINRRAGREAADTVLQRIAQSLSAEAGHHPRASAARMNGADFVLLLPEVTHPEDSANHLLQQLSDLASTGLIDGDKTGHIGISLYQHGESPAAVLARADAALAAAESAAPLGFRLADQGTLPIAASNADWKRLLESAVRTQRLRLIEFPVAAHDGELLHLECPLRLQAGENGEWLAAGSFMPMATRLSMTAELDLAATQLALRRIAEGTQAVAVNLSGESLVSGAFIQQLHTLIIQQRELAPRLWLEISEGGAFQHFDAFLRFSNALRPLGCRLGIEHFGRQFSDIGRLHGAGLNYLKIDGSFIRGIDRQPGNQAFIKGLCSIAHSIGLTVIAESVQSAEELAILPELGFDGATGPAVPRNTPL